jgi:cobalt-zinc-cadmium resistance protein CzcA
MENILASLIKQKLLILFLFVLCTIGGIAAFQSVPIDAFPDLSNNQVQILTETPGMAPMETEQLVTIPIESLMNGLPRVRQVRSISKFGVSVVTVVFEDGVDTYFARQLVNERMQSARGRLPNNLSPELGPITTGMGEIYQYVVEGKGYSAMDLKTLQDWDIKYQLRTVPGVNEVNTWGGLTQEYIVTILPERLVQYKLTLNEVFNALQRNNNNFSGGIIEHGAEQYVVRGLGRVNTLNDIGQIVVKTQGGASITLNKLGIITLGASLRQGAATKDGQGEVVTGIVMMLKGENSRNVIERVKEKIEAIKKSLPEGVVLKPFYDQTQLVEQTIHTVQSNLIEGGVLVIVVLLVMLGNLRAALIVAATIPLSLMFSFMGMKALGITANIMSLGAVDFGMIVDGSIVMVENTLRKLAHPQNPNMTQFEIIQESVKEMARPILFGVLIITVVYMPILALEGMEYKMFSPMVFTVTFALLGSLLIALLLVPVLCSFFLRGKVTEKESFIVHTVRKPYLNLLEKALSQRKLTVGIAITGFVLSVASMPFLGTEFVPKLDEGDLLIEIRNIPSISLTEAIANNTRIEQVVKTIPEVKTVLSRAGRPDLATDPMGVYQTDEFVILKPKNQWHSGINKERIRAQISQRLNRDIPGVNFNFTQPIEMRVNELVSGVKADIAVKLFGDDMTVLTQKAEQIKNILEPVQGVSDLLVEQLSGSGQLLITPDRMAMARYGVDIDDLRTVIETAILGNPVSEVLQGKQRFTLRVKFPEGSKIDPNQVGNLLIETAQGSRIPVSQVARIEVGEGLEVVNREMGQRRIIVQMNVRGRDVGSLVQEAQQKIAKQVHLPSGYYIQWGGQFENQQRAMKKLMIVVPLSILIIFFLLMATFSNIRHALLVIMNVPFALIGGIIALWVRGMYLSVPASVGFIALFGVAILNGLVLISTINKLREEGLTLDEAIHQGAETRLRPVLMTALVATLGFMPMALSVSAGAEVQKPLATVVIGGLVTSTLLTLVVLPVLYRWIEEKNNLERNI